MRNYVLFDKCVYVFRAATRNVGEAPRCLEGKLRDFVRQEFNEDRYQICINDGLNGWIIFDRKQSTQANRGKEFFIIVVRVYQID